MKKVLLFLTIFLLGTWFSGLTLSQVDQSKVSSFQFSVPQDIQSL